MMTTFKGETDMSTTSTQFRGLAPLILLLVGLLAALWRPGLAHAGGAVGNGTPDSCTEAALNAALMDGGLVTFNCGGAKTITFTYYKTIEADTTIDGGGVITLSGGNTASLFQVFDLRRLTLQNITLADGKSAGMAAGAVENFGTTTIVNSTLRDNVSTSTGGAIVNYGTLSLNNTVVSKNQADMAGGGVYNDGGVVNINNSQFSENLAFQRDGGAINVNSGQVDIQNSAFHQNFGTRGGAIHIESEAAAYITASALTNNGAFSGGGIHNEGQLVLSQSTLNLNQAVASNGGGIVFAGQSSGALTRVTLSGNTAEGNGGGLYLQGTVDAGLSLTHSTLSGNSARDHGGAIYNQAATAHLTNVTLSGNSANAGGGIYQNSGLIALSFVSVVSNTAAAFGGGLYNYEAGEMKVQNTVLANNNLGNCDGSGFISLGHNLTNDNHCNAALNLPTDKSGTNVALPLGPLADNGGPTLTHLSLSGNLAIDGGMCIDRVSTDQRNLPRPAGAACDAGAVEVSGLWRLHLPVVVKS
jgi:predicted outer membrane repeat protein